MIDPTDLIARDDKLKVLTFSLGNEIFAVPISEIKEVNRIVKLKKVLKAPTYVVGLINLHGKTTPVLNLKELLNINPYTLSPDAMWIGVEQEDHSFICFAVDKLLRFIDLYSSHIDKMPVISQSANTIYVKCYARINNNLIQILNIKKVIDDRNKDALRQIQGLL